MQGIDSGVATGYIGVLEHGKLVTYSAHYDSNPCGGGCPEQGHTTLYRCTSLGVAATLDGCARYAADCFDCREPAQVADCVFGGRPR